MTLPALDALAAARHELTLVGKQWAKDLFAGYSWPVVALSGSRFEHIRTRRPSVDELLRNSTRISPGRNSRRRLRT